MARKSKGRGTAAAFGLLFLFAGLVGGGVLFVLSQRRPAQAVDGFARAPIGCTTTLDFTETGVFYVFEELAGVSEVPDGGCQPTADPTQAFAFQLRGPDGPVVPRADVTVSYDTGDQVGSSVARIEIVTAGEYEIVVVGDDPAVVAAIGRDPDDGVDLLRRRSVIVAVVGVVLGALLLVLAGRRSKKAAEFLPPAGPGWGPQPTPADPAGVPTDTRSGQVPVNPHTPPEPVAIAPTLDELAEIAARPPSPWAPPGASGTPMSGPEPVPSDDVTMATPDERSADGDHTSAPEPDPQLSDEAVSERRPELPEASDEITVADIGSVDTAEDEADPSPG